MTRMSRVVVDGKVIDLEKLDRDELLGLKTDLEDRSAVIKNRLGRMRRKTARTKIYADSDTFTGLEEKGRRLNRHIQRVNRALAWIKRKKAKAWERRFVDVARTVLSEDTWNSIVSAIERD